MEHQIYSWFPKIRNLFYFRLPRVPLRGPFCDVYSLVSLAVFKMKANWTKKFAMFRLLKGSHWRSFQLFYCFTSFYIFMILTRKFFRLPCFQGSTLGWLFPQYLKFFLIFLAEDFVKMHSHSLLTYPLGINTSAALVRYLIVALKSSK